MMRLNLVVWFLFLCLLQVYARNPGFKARITNKGLKYANDVAIQALKTNVQKLKIPDQSGKESGFKYKIYNINIQEFDPPASTLSINPGSGLSWKGSNANIKIHGDFHYKKWFVSDGGSFDATVSGLTFNLGVDIGEDTAGRPSIASRSCSSDIANVDFKFHGGMAWLYNLFRGKVGKLIKDTLKNQLCTLFNKAINEDAEKKLASLRVTIPLAKRFLLDYRLTQKPAFQTEYLETFHKGEIYWLSEPTKESPLTPPPIPPDADTGSMLYLWVSDYMFDTICDTAQQHGFLVYNMTQKDLPPGNRGVLNTTCDGFIPKCIGKLIPQIGDKFPNMVVELRMNSTQAPKMEVSSAGVSLNFAGVIDLFATKPGTTALPPYLLTLYATMSTTVDVSIQNELLYANIKDMTLKLKVRKSAVGKVDDTFLDFLIREALKAYLIPQLNDLGKKGFPILVTDEIKFQNTKISFVKDTILISTDLQYTPSSQEPVDDPTGPLKFKPYNRVY